MGSWPFLAFAAAICCFVASTWAKILGPVRDGLKRSFSPARLGFAFQASVICQTKRETAKPQSPRPNIPIGEPQPGLENQGGDPPIRKNEHVQSAMATADVTLLQGATHATKVSGQTKSIQVSEVHTDWNIKLK